MKISTSILAWPIAALGLALALLVQPTSVMAQTGTIWFDDVNATTPISEPDTQALLNALSTTITTGSEFAPPSELSADADPRIVFISVSDSIAPASVAMGRGEGIIAATNDALAQIVATGRVFDTLWLKLDIVEGAYVVPDLSTDAALNIDPTLFGLAFDEQSGIAFLAEELFANSLVSQDGLMSPGGMVRYVTERGDTSGADELGRIWSAPWRSAYHFWSNSYFLDSAAPGIYELFRGHRLYPTVTPDEMLLASQIGGSYLIESVMEDGEFHYSYEPGTDRIADSYNTLRHAGTLFAMMELYRVTLEPELLEAGERAADFLLNTITTCTVNGAETACVVDEQGEVKLGGNGLALIAFAEYIYATGDQRFVPIMQQLALWIEATQAENGEFLFHKMDPVTGANIPFISEYYPGEALLGLTRLYAIDANEQWLDIAEAGALWLINVRDAGKADAALPHDHWLLYALNDLYRHRPNPIYLQHAMRLANTIIASQLRTPEYPPDWFGGYYVPPRSTPTATRTEGLCAAYQLARDYGDQLDAVAFLAAMQFGARFQLGTQYREESAMYFANPQRTFGGFRRSLTESDIRIDYVQHNISSLLCLREVMIAS